MESGYRTLPFPFEEWEVSAFGMHMDWTLTDFLGYVATWSAVRAFEREQGSAASKAFERNLARLWDDPAMARTARWPSRCESAVSNGNRRQDR